MTAQNARLSTGLHAQQAPGIRWSKGLTGNSKDTTPHLVFTMIGQSQGLAGEGWWLPADGPPRGCKDGRGAGVGGGAARASHAEGASKASIRLTLLAAVSTRSVSIVRQHGPPTCEHQPRTPPFRPRAAPGPPISVPHCTSPNTAAREERRLGVERHAEVVKRKHRRQEPTPGIGSKVSQTQTERLAITVAINRCELFRAHLKHACDLQYLIRKAGEKHCHVAVGKISAQPSPWPGPHLAQAPLHQPLGDRPSGSHLTSMGYTQQPVRSF